MKNLLTWLAILLPFYTSAQMVNNSAQRNETTKISRFYNTGTTVADTVASVQAITGFTTGQTVIWNNTLKKFQSGTAGVNGLGAFGSTPNANGASISGNTLTLQPASASFPGGVTTGNQTFEGFKTFNNNVMINGVFDVFTSQAGINIVDFTNTSASGLGLYIKAGNPTNYALSVNDYNGVSALTVLGNGNGTFAGSVTATSLLEIIKNGTGGGLSINRTGASASLFTLLNSGGNINFAYNGSGFIFNQGISVGSGYTGINPPSDGIIISGNVGIGSTGPLSKLSINGGVHVGGDSDAGDNNLLVDGTLGINGSANNVTSGTHTPTATLTSNLTSFTANECTYEQIGNVVTYSGSFSVNITAASTNCVMTFTKPVTSNFTAQADANGTMNSFTTGFAYPLVEANAATDEIKLEWQQGSTGTSKISFTLQYKVK